MTHRLDAALTRLAQIDSPDLPILSVYLNLYPEWKEKRSVLPRLRNLLHPIRDLAGSGDLEHEASMSLRRGVDHVLAMAPDLEATVDTSVAVFILPHLQIEETLGLPGRVWDCAVAGPRAYLRPLRAVLDEFRRVAAVVLDSRRAEIIVFHMGETVDRHVIEAEEVRKSHLAGWYGLDEYRNRQRAEEIRHHLFREVAEQLERLRREGGVEAVFLGGKKDSTDGLLPFLDPRVRAMTETFVIDLHTLTPPLLAKTVAELQADYERRKEERMVEETYKKSAAGDLAVIGVDRVAEAANRHAISQLLVHDGAAISGAVCPSCGALSHPRAKCGRCGAETNPVPDLIEALTRSVIEASGQVEHVMAKTPLESDLVVAQLRFAIW